MERRKFIQGSLALGASAAFGSITGCINKGDEPQAPITFEPGQPTPWINWAGNHSCIPSTRLAPS
jgi:hypothetical protein